MIVFDNKVCMCSKICPKLPRYFCRMSRSACVINKFCVLLTQLLNLLQNLFRDNKDFHFKVGN